MQQRTTTALRTLLSNSGFINMPSAYDAIGGRLIASLGFPAVYTGGFVTGGSRCTSEPLLTMDEQVRVAGDVAAAVTVPLVADGGAGFGEPLHTMRSVREFIRAGVAGIHIEDQLYPKRAHYHKYVAHVTPRDEFVAKIEYACRQRAESDPDFVIIARSDACRFEGLQEAIDRINLAADVGADMGLVFPRNDEELRQAPKIAKVPLVYVMSRGNRDQRPLPTIAELEAMGYKACIDAVTSLVVAFTAVKRAFDGNSRDRHVHRSQRPGMRRCAPADRGPGGAGAVLRHRGGNGRTEALGQALTEAFGAFLLPMIETRRPGDHEESILRPMGTSGD